MKKNLKKKAVDSVAVYVESVTVKDGPDKITVLHSEIHDGKSILFKDDSIIRYKSYEDSIIAGICIALEQKHVPHKDVEIYTSNERVVYRLNSLIGGTELPKKAVHIRFLSDIDHYGTIEIKPGGLLSRYMRDSAKMLAERKKKYERCLNSAATIER